MNKGKNTNSTKSPLNSTISPQKSTKSRNFLCLFEKCFFWLDPLESTKVEISYVYLSCLSGGSAIVYLRK